MQKSCGGQSKHLQVIYTKIKVGTIRGRVLSLEGLGIDVDRRLMAKSRISESYRRHSPKDEFISDRLPHGRAKNLWLLGARYNATGSTHKYRQQRRAFSSLNERDVHNYPHVTCIQAIKWQLGGAGVASYSIKTAFYHCI
jgi:hypothetical protein